MKIKIYLDNCCFNRPYDDQLQPVIYLETIAKLYIQSEIYANNIDLVWSFILHYENEQNRNHHRKAQIGLWKERAKFIVEYDKALYDQAKQFGSYGIKTKDALHIACALYAEARYFITTDKRLLNKRIDGIEIINPIDFFRRHYDKN